MKHANLLIVFLLSSFISLQAQTTFGIKFEYGITSQKIEEQMVVPSRNENLRKVEIAKLGNSTSVGLMSQFSFGYLFLQPEILYTRYTNEFDVNSFNIEPRSSYSKITERFENIEFPINAGVRLGALRLGGGPIFTHNIALESDFGSFENTTVTDRTFTSGFQGLIGYDYKNFHIDIKYHKGFNSVTEHIAFKNANYELKSTSNSIRIGITYSL